MSRIPEHLAPRDGYGVPGMYEKDGALRTTGGGRKLQQVLKLNAAQIRNKELFDIQAKEMTIAISDVDVILYPDEPKDSKGMTISKNMVPLHLALLAERFYLSNQSGSGRIEIWIWE